MKKLGMALCTALGMATMMMPAFPQTAAEQGKEQAIVTVLPQNEKAKYVDISAQDLDLRINGKDADITDWVSLQGPLDKLELVVLIDDSARVSLGRQLGEIADFIQRLPVDTKAAVGYMSAGRAVIAGPLSLNHAGVAGELRLPGGTPGSNASPYFCLSDLAKHWPSADQSARREVVLISDGVDRYFERYDPEDPYVKTSIDDSIRAGLVVYSVYWRGQGRTDNFGLSSLSGQSLLEEVTRATGGASYYNGTGEPVTLTPYFKDIVWRLQNQYRLEFRSRSKGKTEIRRMTLNTRNPAAKLMAPQRVLIAD
jgi:hypothetical protein